MRAKALSSVSKLFKHNVIVEWNLPFHGGMSPAASFTSVYQLVFMCLCSAFARAVRSWWPRAQNHYCSHQKPPISSESRFNDQCLQNGCECAPSFKQFANRCDSWASGRLCALHTHIYIQFSVIAPAASRRSSTDFILGCNDVWTINFKRLGPYHSFVHHNISCIQKWGHRLIYHLLLVFYSLSIGVPTLCNVLDFF